MVKMRGTVNRLAAQQKAPARGTTPWISGMDKNARRRAQRRSVLPGYPIERPFESKEEVLTYLSGSKVTCLLCGKRFLSVATHLARTHAMDPDEYRGRYRIPWTYPLCAQSVTDKHAADMHRRMDEGWAPPIKVGADQAKMISKEKRQRPFEPKENLGAYTEPKRPLQVGPNGEPETFTKSRERSKAKRGSEEFHTKMVNRPHMEASKEAIATYWKGRKQSESHITKRMKAIHGPDWEPKGDE